MDSHIALPKITLFKKLNEIVFYPFKYSKAKKVLHTHLYSKLDKIIQLQPQKL